MQGFLNLHKPFGLTSHDCVARVRRLLKLKRVGHGGTLDPAATGVLPIAIGRATRLLQYLSHEKTYRAKIRFGITTSTDDLAGEILTQAPAAHLSLAQLQRALPQFQGTIEQIPPSYSAIQVGGKRLYELARSGQAVTAPKRTVEVHRIEILAWHPGEFPELELDIACGSGTYIRSIARDLGAVLGIGGTLAALIRTSSSGFHLKDSLTLDQLEQQITANCFGPLPPALALQHLPLITLPLPQANDWQQGKRLVWEELPDSKQADLTLLLSTPCRLQTSNGAFLGIGQVTETQSGKLLIPKLVWS
ncbi:tRNA pseudouridine(55) synthase TruB [Leptolyngbya sp. NK1-12]|uniref:tRNA pseudouridine synthase B n=1 Tax=Leptolyngbya sp. NK1-12 TaxID=2547451 RepID=A0AA96WB78_9CYAN|nr:tRNA pseudouridine(55) synthase TruB [Leptolyngbya sp. NK1-12]WNZ21844.1 tRNA pseudouridine(55) synthase TruB [Leptolyngbya sp. NK1-12]